MEDFTLMHFLDRFVHKNPKKIKDQDKPGNFRYKTLQKINFNVSYYMRCTAKKSIFKPAKSMQKSSIRNLPINSKEYLSLDYNQIPEEEKIFYKSVKMMNMKQLNMKRCLINCILLINAATINHKRKRSTRSMKK